MKTCKRPMFTALAQLAAAFMLMAAGAAGAVEYRQVVTNESTVGFGYSQMGVPSDGRFGKFDAQLSFDPAKPDKAQAKIVIDIASIDTGSDEANDEVVGKLWFDTAHHPTAIFVSSSMKSLGGTRYLAGGKLTIKGRAHDVSVPVVFAKAGVSGQFDGVLNINRLDFAIGEGMWADVGTVANEVQIKFHFVVAAAPNKK